jgi:heat shock protein HslJ
VRGPALAAGVLALLLLGIGTGGCATTETPDPAELDLGAAGATEADGVWVAIEVRLGGEVVPLDGAGVVVELDTATARLDGSTGCNRLLGSFTLRPDGEARFTIPQRGLRDCPPPAQAREDAVLAALDGATRWEVDGDRLLLTGPASQLELRRA